MSNNVTLLKYVQRAKIIGVEEAAKEFGIKTSSFERKIREAKRLGLIEQEISQDVNSIKKSVENIEATVFRQKNDSANLSGQARTLDELLEKAGVDLDYWEVESYEIKDNSWDVTMKNVNKDLTFTDGTINGHSKQKPGGDTVTNKQYYIKAKLVKRKDLTATNKFRKEMVEEFKTFSPKTKLNLYKTNESGNILEVNIPDLHLGKNSWAEETGFRNYNIKIAEKRYKTAFDEMLSEALQTKTYEQILFVVGNDLFNSDNAYPITTTTAGTPQQDDTRWQKVFRTGRRLMIESILTLSQIAPVKVLVIPGNHDFQKSFYLGDVLEAYFHNNPNIDIDNSPRTRKYFKWGKCLLGFAHGSRKDEGENRLLNNMKHECAKEWGDTVYREWHCGDIHHYKELKQRGSSKDIDKYAEDIDGVMIKYLRTLMFNDEWEARKGFISQKGAHMFVWNKESGNTHEFKYNKYE